jgi:hypothetical protein
MQQQVVVRDLHTKLEYIEAYKKEKEENSISLNAFANKNQVNSFLLLLRYLQSEHEHSLYYINRLTHLLFTAG